MTDKIARVLIVDDEPLNLEIILEYLEDGPYELETAADGQDAWDRLEADPAGYDVVLLDRMMPRLTGMAVLERIKSHPVLESVPVILQTALAARDDMLEGLRAGAYYYLTKPFDEQMLVSVMATAVEDRLRYLRLQAESAASARTLGLLSEGRFRFRTLAAARDLATVLAHAFPAPQRVVIGLSELLVNAVEHGNLGIGYDEKSRLKAEQAWEREVERRLADPGYGQREVEVAFSRDGTAIEVLITDQGEGFDWSGYVEMAPDRVFDTHGRGIAMASMLSFDAIEYLGKGNRVRARVMLDSAASDDAHVAVA